jgi:hypothetical protein
MDLDLDRMLGFVHILTDAHSGHEQKLPFR